MGLIKTIEINRFRGIQRLTVSDFSQINLLAGDNNSGKTTFLEAIQLLFASPNLSAVKNIIGQRTVLNPNSSFYTSFINMFSMEQDKNHLDFDIYADSDRGALEIEIQGLEKNISGEEALQRSMMPLRQKELYKKSMDTLPEMVRMFSGSIMTRSRDKTSEKKICCTSLDHTVSGLLSRRGINYVSSFGHLRYDLLKNIVDNTVYKKLVIDILRQFDDTIEDICYTKADDGTFLESIVTKNGTIMPFSVYGDGIKKMLFILNKLFDSADSLLLIDEIETGLHKKYYDTLFPVIFELAKKLNVQLFIATHSMEVIEAILRYGNYDNEIHDCDPVRVITLKKVQSDKGSNVVARNVTGKYVYDNRKVFAFEVRL